MELNNMLNILFEANRTTKRLISVLIDSGIIVTAFWLSLILRLETFSVFTETKYWIVVVNKIRTPI